MMKNNNLQIKLYYVPGLRDIVFNEIKDKLKTDVVREDKDALYVEYSGEFDDVKELGSVSRASLVDVSDRYNPLYISNHKSVLGNLILEVINKSNKSTFKTFKISCAGSGSVEILKIKEYISSEFKLEESENADLKVHIAKIHNVWEVGVQITKLPLSYREYKVNNMSGAMNPTIAYSLNYLCELDKYNTYLNIFSGSGTLMIEAGLNYPNLEKIIGFDNNKEHLSLSIQNIKKAGLIKKVKIKESDIFDNPDLGKFDVIASDLPFGMSISKGEDIESIYKSVINYCENNLNPRGRLGIYTSEFKIFEKLILDSKFNLEKEVKIDLMTNEGEYLPVKIMIFSF